MAGLKKSEKRLLIVFGIVLFVLANLVGDYLLASRKSAARVATQAHKEKITESELLLRTKETWQKRKNWLDQRQPRYASEETAATEIENHIRLSANAAGASIDSLKPQEPITLPGEVQVAWNANVSGTNEEVTRFISLLQDRDGFYDLPSTTFTSDRKDPTILRAVVNVARRYSTAPSSTAPTGGAAAPAGIAARPESDAAGQN